MYQIKFIKFDFIIKRILKDDTTCINNTTEKYTNSSSNLNVIINKIIKNLIFEFANEIGVTKPKYTININTEKNKIKLIFNENNDNIVEYICDVAD